MATTAALSFLTFLALARLTNASFEDLHIRLSRLLYQFNFKHTILNALIKDYTQYVNTFGLSIRGLGASPLTQKVTRADRRRDRIMRNVPRLIRAGLNSDDPQVVEAAEALQTIYNDYRSDASSQMGAQTEQIKGMIRNMTSDDYFDAVKKVPGLLATLTQLEQANNDFYTLYTERYNERIGRPEHGLNSTELRKLIVTTCREIFRLINSIIGSVNLGDETTEDKTKLEKLILEVVGLFTQYKVVNAMQGRKRPMDADGEIREGAREIAAGRHLEAEGEARVKEGEEKKMAAALRKAEALVARAEEQIAEDKASATADEECPCDGEQTPQ